MFLEHRSRERVGVAGSVTTGNHIIGVRIRLASPLRRCRFDRHSGHRRRRRHLEYGRHRLTVFKLRDEADAVLDFLLNTLQLGLRCLKGALGHQVGGVGFGESLTAGGALAYELYDLLLEFEDCR